jgi:glycine cleavage system H lipoate-binding protein
MKTSQRTTATPTDGTSACFWMQAGVVRRKECRLDYQCQECRFDQAMRQAARKAAQARAAGKPLAGAPGKIVFWKDKLNERPPWQQPCVHHMKGQIDFKACTNEYRCDSCEFDQYFQDQFAVHAVVNPVDVLDVHGFKIPQGYYLHPGHTWIKIEEGGEVRVGLDDFALRLLGPFDGIELPLMGKEIVQERSQFLGMRQHLQARILSPISGVVTDVNPDIREKPGAASRSPYSSGWMVRVHAGDLRGDLKRLMIGAETVDFLKNEVDRLYQVIEEEAGPLAADGGYLADDIFGHLPQLDWDRLTRLFLRS